MRRHQAATIVVALLVGLSPTTALFVSRLGGSASPRSGASGEELPWPYCAPDAEPPAFSPLPFSPLSRSGPTVDRPLVALPLAEVLLPIETIELGAPVAEEDFEGKQRATARTGPAIFQSKSSVDRFGALSGGPESIVSDSSLLKMIADRLQLGDEVAIGVSARWDDGSLSFAFAIDLTTGEVMRYGPYADQDNAILRRFVASRFPEASSGPARAELLVRWNREQSESTRPISDEWVRFLRDTYGIGREIPEPGTEEWWETAPPRCRSLLDAPPSVTASLDPVTVWLRVPAEMVVPTDAVICLRIQQGSMGCTMFRPNPESEYIELAAFSDGANPISVQVARETPDGISWIDRTEIARIPASLATGPQAILVTLNPDLGGSTYEEVASHAKTAESSVSGLSVGEEQRVQEAIAQA